MQQMMHPKINNLAMEQRLIMKSNMDVNVANDVPLNFFFSSNETNNLAMEGRAFIFKL